MKEAIIITLILALLLLFSLPGIIRRQNLAHLKEYRCTPQLYHVIDGIKGYYAGTETIRVETSYKVQPDGTTIWNRYVIPILLSEWYRYTEEDQQTVCSAVGFNPGSVRQILANHKKQITPSTDIIFGQEGNKGKIYLDFDTNSLVCYESNRTTTKPTKTYTQTDKGAADVLIVKDSDGNTLGTHTRNTDGKNNVYWISHVKSGTSYYTRPSRWVLLLSEITDAAKLLAPFAF